MAKTKRAKRVYREADVRRKIFWVIITVSVVILVVQGWNLNKQQEESALLAQERDEAFLRAELIITSAPVALVMCGETGHIALCNPSAEHMLGWDHKDLVGQHISVLIPDDFHEEHAAKFGEAVNKMKEKPEDWLMMHQGIKTQAKRKDGKLTDILLTIRMIKYNGKVEFISAMRCLNKDEHILPPSMPLPPLPQQIQQQAQQQRFKR
jgi:PAS domain S-box-containing protein